MASIITAGVVLVGVGTVLMFWKAGKAVVAESVTHPLTKSVIHVEPDGDVVVRRESTDNRINDETEKRQETKENHHHSAVVS